MRTRVLTIAFGLLAGLFGSGCSTPDSATAPTGYVGGKADQHGLDLYGAYATDFDDAYLAYAEVKLNLDGEPTIHLGWSEGHLEYEDILRVDGETVSFGFESGDDCDDPGCGYLGYVEGTFDTETHAGVETPVIRMTVTMHYDFPEYDGDREGDYTVEYVMEFAGEIEDVEPFFRAGALDETVATELEACEQGRSTFSGLTCPSIQAFDFRVPVEGEAYEDFLSAEVAGVRWDTAASDVATMRSVLLAELYRELAYLEALFVNEDNRDAFERLEDMRSALPSALRALGSDRVIMQKPWLAERGDYGGMTFLLIDDEAQRITLVKLRD